MTYNCHVTMSQETTALSGGELYIHIGLHKTGSTFLQQTIFPFWPGLRFCNVSVKLAPLMCAFREQKVLISNEHLWCNRLDWLDSDERWRRMADPALVEESIEGVHRLFPKARILLSFRHHFPWIRSLYTQYLQEGGTATFEEFFDFEHDQGTLKKEYICFRRVIEQVEDLFPTSPLIYLQEELRDDLEGTLRQIGDYMNCPPPSMESLRAGLEATRRHNRSVGHYQAKALRFLNRLSKSDLNTQGKLPLRSRRFYVRWFGLHPRDLCQWGILSWILPNRPAKLDPDLTAAITEYFADDWQYVLRKKEQYMIDRSGDAVATNGSAQT